MHFLKCLPVDRNAWEVFCIRIISPICTVFNTKYSIVHFNKLYQFQDRVFQFQEYLRDLELTQKDRQTESINTFQLCWKVLKRAINIY